MVKNIIQEGLKKVVSTFTWKRPEKHPTKEDVCSREGKKESNLTGLIQG